MSVREDVRQKLYQISQNPGMYGVEATEHMNFLTGHLGIVGEHIDKHYDEFIKEKIKLMQENDKLPISRVEILAQGTEAYRLLRETKTLREAMIEAIRGLKYRVRALEDEYENS